MNPHTVFTPHRVRNTLDAGEVRRYHAVPSVRPQSVGLHSWGVAVLCIYLLENDVSAQLLKEAIMHDTAELFTGDVPYTVKRDLKDVKERFDMLETHVRNEYMLLPRQQLSKKEEAVLKLADTLDGLFWCVKYETNGPVGGRWYGALDTCFAKFEPLFAGTGILERAKSLVEQVKSEPHAP